MKRKKKVNKFLLNKFMEYGLHIAGIKWFSNPKANVYLLGFRNNFGILDLSLTQYNIRRVLKILSKVVVSRKKILFVGAPVGLEKNFTFLCKKSGHFYLDDFTDGFFSNFGNSNLDLFNAERPSLIFFFNGLKYQKVKKDVLGLNIPVLAFVSTDANLDGIDYLIPANIYSWRGGLFVYNLLFNLLLFTDRFKSIKK